MLKSLTKLILVLLAAVFFSPKLIPSVFYSHVGTGEMSSIGGIVSERLHPPHSAYILVFWISTVEMIQIQRGAGGTNVRPIGLEDHWDEVDFMRMSLVRVSGAHSAMLSGWSRLRRKTVSNGDKLVDPLEIKACTGTSELTTIMLEIVIVEVPTFVQRRSELNDSLSWNGM